MTTALASTLSPAVAVEEAIEVRGRIKRHQRPFLGVPRMKDEWYIPEGWRDGWEPMRSVETPGDFQPRKL